MDIFAHMAWTNVVFYKKYKNEIKNRFIAILFGVLPDLASFAPIFIYGFVSRQGFLELAFSSNFWARYASESYNFTHSMVLFALVFGLICVFRKVLGKPLIYWPIFGWALHIIIDIFTHRGFYETPFLFPLSPYRFSNGISWAHPTFMIINYSVLALIYLFWFLVLRKKEVKKTINL